MKNTLKMLNYISTKIDLNLFYVITIRDNEIRLQGYKSNKKEINAHFKIDNKLDENNWFKHYSIIDDVYFNIILT